MIYKVNYIYFYFITTWFIW